MIVIKSTAEYAATVRRVASEQKLYREETITDLNQAAGILEDLAAKEARQKAAGIYSDACHIELNVLEDEA